MGIIHQRIADLAPAREFAVKPLPAEELARGMIVRAPNWLGDALMTLPAVRALREMLPEKAPLVIIGPMAVTSLFRMLPGITGVLTVEAHETWTENACEALRKLAIPNGILFTNSFRDAWQLRDCGVKNLYGKAARCRGFLLRRSFHFPKWKNGVLNESHHALENLSMVMALGGKRPEPLMPVLKPNLRLDQLRFKFQCYCQHPKLMVLAPGAAYGAAKRWSSENFSAVAKAWIQQGGIAVVVGAPNEADIGIEVITGLPENRAFNLSGQTELSALCYLLRTARVCVANDSGIMHLAAALGTPGVAVFGPTDYRATGPVANNWLLVFDKEKCAPCFKRVCPKKAPKCMQKITPEEVIKAVDQVAAR